MYWLAKFTNCHIKIINKRSATTVMTIELPYKKIYLQSAIWQALDINKPIRVWSISF